MRLKIYFFSITVAIALISGLATVFFSNLGGSPGSILRKQQMERVGLSMTRAEVETLLGGPPGDYCSDPERFTVEHQSITQFPRGFNFEDWKQVKIVYWRGDEAEIEVWFGADERVVHRRICEPIDGHPPIHRRLAVWLREQASRVSLW